MKDIVRVLPIGRGPIGREHGEMELFRSAPKFKGITETDIEYLLMSSDPSDEVHPPEEIDQIVQVTKPDIVLVEARFLPSVAIAAVRAEEGGPSGTYPDCRFIIFCKNKRKNDEMSLKEFRVVRADENYHPSREEVESREKFLVFVIGPDEPWLTGEQQRMLESIPKQYGINRKALLGHLPMRMPPEMWLDMLTGETPETDPNVVIIHPDVPQSQARAILMQLKHHRRPKDRENQALPSQIPFYLFKEGGTNMERLHLKFTTLAPK